MDVDHSLITKPYSQFWTRSMLAHRFVAICADIGIVVCVLLAISAATIDWGRFPTLDWYARSASYVLLILIVLQIVNRTIRRRRARRFWRYLELNEFRVCPDCGYLLRGAPTANCPECGAKRDWTTLARTWESWMMVEKPPPSRPRSSP